MLRQPPQLNYPRATVLDQVKIKLEITSVQGGISLLPPLGLASKLQRLPPRLNNKNKIAMTRYSKAS